MHTPDQPGSRFRKSEPPYARRVFGLFLVIGLGGFAWSLGHAPAALSSLTASAPGSDVGQAYAACLGSVRQSALDPSRLRFPAEPESVEAGDDAALDLSSSVTATPKLGEPYTQHFTCRAARVGRGASAAWKVSRMAMDLPVS